MSILNNTEAVAKVGNAVAETAKPIPGAKTKGWIKNNSTGVKKSFQYNPTTFAYSRGATYADISAPGSCYPDTQFVKGNVRSFPVSLFLYDNPNTGYIKDFMSFLGGFLTPEINIADYTRPATMTFCMGYFVRTCVLEDFNIIIEQFDDSGEPIQAVFELQIRQVGIT